MAADLILASGSPRRREILATVGIDHEVQVSRVDESGVSRDLHPEDYAKLLAQLKAAAVAAELESGLVLGADTIVVLDGQILGQPADAADACAMLATLSGRTHAVVTGVCLIDVAGGTALVEHETTLVVFKDLTPEEILWYVETGEPLDKAGAYGIQGRAGLFVERIEGCYFNVVGLPLNRVYRMLSAYGYRCF